MAYVVFNPNRADKRDNFLHDCRSNKRVRWTCNKRSRVGEIHLFYFAAPVSAVVGFGVVSKNFGPHTGKFDWKKGSTAYFCRLEPLIRLPKRISAAVLASGRLRKWWATKPYRGLPKRIPDRSAKEVLRLIIAQGGRAAEPDDASRGAEKRRSCDPPVSGMTCPGRAVPPGIAT